MFRWHHNIFRVTNYKCLSLNILETCHWLVISYWRRIDKFLPENTRTFSPASLEGILTRSQDNFFASKHIDVSRVNVLNRHVATCTRGPIQKKVCPLLRRYLCCRCDRLGGPGACSPAKFWNSRTSETLFPRFRGRFLTEKS